MKKRGLFAAGAILLVVGTGTTLVVAGQTTRSPPRSRAAAAVPDRQPAPQVSRRVVGTPAYQAVANESEHPGAVSFRAYTDDFCDSAHAEVEAQMAAEHLSEAEVRDLTMFGMEAKTSLDWDAVEVATGHSIDPNARRYAEDAMLEESAKMKDELRAQVAAGADEAARRQTIDRIEQEYLDRYDQLTGMDADLLDWMLWQYVQEHQEETPDEADVPAGPLPPGVTLTHRNIVVTPPPPPPADAPPPGAPVPAPTD